MLDISKIVDIIDLTFNQGKNECQIANTLEVSSNTVIKYLNIFKEKVEELGFEVLFQRPINRQVINNLVEEFYTPYDSSHRKPRVYNKEDVCFIKNLIIEESLRTKEGCTKRSISTLYKIAQEHDFKGSFSTFYNLYLKIKKTERKIY